MRVYADGCIFNGTSSEKMGLILCSFEGTSLETTTTGSKINIVTKKISNRDKQYLYSANYNEVLEYKLHFIKKDRTEMQRYELVNYGRWLQHREYKQFQFISNNFADILFYSITTEMNELSIGGKCFGIEVKMSTNAPYGFTKEITKIMPLSSSPYRYINQSEEYGYVYPNMKITVNETGDLIINNLFEHRETKITSCAQGEVISLNCDKKIITSTSPINVAERFNWKWFRFCRSEYGNINEISSSIACTVEFIYQNIKKVGVS